MKGQLTALDGKYQAILTGLADNKKEFDALKSQMDGLKTQISDQLKKIDQLTAQLTQQGADIEKLNAELAAVKASLGELLFKFDQLLTDQTSIIQDHEGNVYKTVKIGKQFWMAENLNVSKWKDGLENPYWIQSKYGKLYYSKAFASSGGICPVGWRIPTNSDWEELFKFLGGDLKNIGGKLKKSGLAGWSSSSGGTVGFDAIPNGIVKFEDNQNKIINENTTTVFWGSSGVDDQFPSSWYALKSNSNEITINEAYLGNDFSCRCIKNQ
jgi:uncharacterized protein (TIGR02145 family)